MPTSAYKVTITNTGAANAAPNDGFIDNLKIEYYIPDMSAPPSDLTFALSMAKRRANLRYKNLIAQIGIAGNMDIQAASIVATGSGYKTEATMFSFITFLPHGDSELYTPDELNPGLALVGIPAMVRLISRALVYTATSLIDIYDPTPLATMGNATLVPRFGNRIEPILVGPVVATLPNAAARITVVNLFDQ